MENNGQNFEGVFTRLLSTVLKEASEIGNSMNSLVNGLNEQPAPVEKEQSQETNNHDQKQDEINIEFTENDEVNISNEEKEQKEDNKQDEPKVNSFSDLLSSNNLLHLEEALHEMAGKVKDYLGEIDKMMKARSFFLEQLKSNTCTFEDARKKTIEQFNLKETTQFELDVKIN